ncbi:DUF167 domain-containing protein [Tropicimonas aquimaris]|uniref:DUF167 domain-containing protein n=1 Tax=Tropicimonas aquimaris TaxID=914152 RepID=A0ABW3ISI7_9RHOB
MKHGVLSDLSVPGTQIEVRVTPNASHDDLLVECMGLRVFITDNIDSEKVNESTTDLLAAENGGEKVDHGSGGIGGVREVRTSLAMGRLAAP